MEERFYDEFVTWHHKTPMGIKVDEVFGMDSKSGRVWMELARQIFCEQGEPNYRVIEHYENGAPYIEGYNGRISITHTTHFFAVASLPKTPEVNLSEFNPRTAMGIDAEPIDRVQVLKVRNKFLSEEEIKLIPENDIVLNIVAWTAKEALYKAALVKGLDFKNALKITVLPSITDSDNLDKSYTYGEAQIIFPENLGVGIQEMKLYSYISYNCCVTIAFSPKCAKFGKH